MSEPQPPAPPPSEPKDGEIPLEDIDRLLEEVDPDFTKSLEEVRAVESDKDVVIDAAAIDELAGEQDAAEDDKGGTFPQKLKARVRLKWSNFRLALSLKMHQLWAGTFIFLKSRPKEFALYSFAMSKVLAKRAQAPIKAFLAASRLQQATVLILISIVAASLWTLRANFKGIWIPQISEPLLTNLEMVADSVDSFAPQEVESFYGAFPQERHEYLFPKMKVNLRRTKDNANPMGAFEVVVLVDSKDTAIELSDRKVEFSDMLQRVWEDESFNDLESELGKKRLKTKMLRELNQKLTQGYAKEVSFKTFVLKP